MDTNIVPKRILGNLLTSLSAGVVPRSGAPYIAIGRTDEISAFLSDLEGLDEGRGGMRFLIGRYGSGKSFLLQLIRGYALDRDYLCADCDLSPERRLYGTNGTGIATYRELLKNLAVKFSPDGGALPKILAKWMNDLELELAMDNMTVSDDGYIDALFSLIAKKLKSAEYLVGGFDFCRVVTAFCRATAEENGELESACLRWLRGEFSAKTEARNALGFSVSAIINDENWYDFLKLWAEVAKAMGYHGLLVFIDECVNLYKIPNRVSRENNYEKILSMFNDTLQGRAPGLEIVMGGTPQFLEDTRRGLFSYDALKSRLADGKYVNGEYRNMLGPVIRLKRLSDDELLALLLRITNLHGQYYKWEPRVTEAQMVDFLQLSLSVVGGAELLTPREMIRDYLSVLNILYQNPETFYSDVVKSRPPMQDTVKEKTEFHISDISF